MAGKGLLVKRGRGRNVISWLLPLPRLAISLVCVSPLILIIRTREGRDKSGEEISLDIR